MPISNEAVTVRQFIEMLESLDDADKDIPIKVRESHGDYGIYSLRKKQVTETDIAHDDEAKPQKEKYVLING